VKRAFQVILCIGLFFLHNGCTSSINQSPKTSNESAEIRVKRYETRARTYQALADAQNLSPAYSNPGFRNYSKLGGHKLILTPDFVTTASSAGITYEWYIYRKQSGIVSWQSRQRMKS